jgi:hypothetical protein
MKCVKCDSTNTYVLMDKTIVCRRCGERGKSEGQKGKYNEHIQQTSRARIAGKAKTV